MKRLKTATGGAVFAAIATLFATQTMAQPAHSMSMAPAGTPVSATSVQIQDFAFQPQAIVVAPGATVTWTNADDEPHTVAATDRAYRSTPLDTGQTYSRVYTAPGEYRYFCSLHPHMTGVVIVRAPGAPQGS